MRLLEPGELLADRDELVAAQARHDVGRAQHRAQPAGDRLEQLVAHVVAVAVVDRLEAVEVEEQHAGQRPVAAGARQRDPQAVVQQRAVGQAR